MSSRISTEHPKEQHANDNLGPIMRHRSGLGVFLRPQRMRAKHCGELPSIFEIQYGHMAT